MRGNTSESVKKKRKNIASILPEVAFPILMPILASYLAMQLVTVNLWNGLQLISMNVSIELNWRGKTDKNNNLAVFCETASEMPKVLHLLVINWDITFTELSFL